MTSLDRRKLRPSSLIALPRRCWMESVSDWALIRFLHATAIHLYDVRPQEDRARDPARDPEGHHAGLLPDGEDRGPGPDRRGELHAPPDHGRDRQGIRRRRPDHRWLPGRLARPGTAA